MKSSNSSTVREPITLPKRNTLLVSVKPRFARAILDGSKSVELRRVRPASLRPGDPVLLYSSSPQRELVGTAVVESLDEGAPDTIWARVAPISGLGRGEYAEYFRDAHVAVAIHLRDVRTLAAPVPLAEMRSRRPGLEPPQSFRYLKAAQVQALLDGAALAA